MKEFMRSVLLIWQYGMSPSLTDIKGSLPNKNWLCCFFPSWSHFIAYYLLFLIPGAFIGYIKVAGFDMKDNWLVTLVFALNFPLLWRAGQLWLVFCACAANLLTSDSASVPPKIERHARLACISIFLIITTLAALLIALRFGSFWWAFWGIGTSLLLFSRSLSKIAKFLLLQLPLILILFSGNPLLRTDAALLICLLILCLACIHLYKTALQPAKDATTQAANRQPNLPRLYAWLLQRDCTKRSPALILHALWPRRPWIGIGIPDNRFYAFLPWAIATAWAVKLLLWPWLGDYHGSSWQFFGQLIFIPLALALMNEDPQLAPMKQTRHEQALFRLSPLAPDSQQLNQVLARLLLRERFFDWLFISGLFMSCAALFGMSGEILLAQLAACSIRLPLLAEPLKNDARLPARQHDDGWASVKERLTWSGGIFLLVFAAWFLVSAFRLKTDWAAHFLVWWSAGLLLVNLTLTAKHLPSHWRRMATARFAFHFGRLDD